MTYRFTIDDEIEFAARKVGIEGWQGYKWERTDNGALILGCVPDGVYQRGPRKGWPRFDKPMPGTTRHICILTSEMIAHAAEYERVTHKCWDCKGLGTILASWSPDGRKFADCPRCGV